MNSKKIYFASDFHLGSTNHEQSRKREDKIISWLNTIEKDAMYQFNFFKEVNSLFLNSLSINLMIN
tara:strand:+ start:233 stop:430 length:198 start_codon:yes stop_codon:yes gene_type:complete